MLKSFHICTPHLLHGHLHGGENSEWQASQEQELHPEGTERFPDKNPVGTQLVSSFGLKHFGYLFGFKHFCYFLVPMCAGIEMLS